MKSLQDYIDTFRSIATQLNIQGESAEVLSQMLANASYISEVENISYAQEASLEKATLINSKIQHCMDDMYSVFRGTCPRVILNIKPTKFLSFQMFDKIISGNGFDIYYLGYYDAGSDGNKPQGSKSYSSLKNFIYSPKTCSPIVGDSEDSVTIVGLLCKQVVNKEWIVDASNTYYVSCEDDNLSNDIWVKVQGEYRDVTRNFSEHIIDGKIFDLTLPGFGSRLFISEIFKNTLDNLKDSTSTATPNTVINAQYFKFSELSEYNNSDLKRINLKGTNLINFSSDFLDSNGFKEFEKGIILVSQSDRDGLNTIHYKANRDRFVNSILRSNSDIGTVLEEMFPDKIVTDGTSYNFIIQGENSSTINIYYIPKYSGILLSKTDISNFKDSRSSYYITKDINIIPGNSYKAIFNIDLEVYRNEKIDEEVKSILAQYGFKFNMNLEEKVEEIKSLISKISNVKQIISLNIEYTNPYGELLEDIRGIDYTKSYFNIDKDNCIINSIIR